MNKIIVADKLLKKKANKEKYNKKMTIVKKNIDLYFIMLLPLVFLIVFKYIPMYGLVIAFKDFNIFKGVMESPWVGFKHFVALFTSPEFYMVFRNTFLISIYRLAFTFPLPILIAVMLNEIKNKYYVKIVQTIIYMPHFLSWVVVGSITIAVLSTQNGIVNGMIKSFGGDPVNFLTNKDWFRSILILSGAWKEAGWSAIVFIAAIAGIDQEIYEAAKIDGANRFQRIINITIPGLASTIVLMLILKLGHILDVGTEQVLVLYNPVVYEVGDVIGTYVYRMGISKMDYSFSTAVGFFNSIVGLVLVLSGNYLSKRMLDRSIW